MAARVTSRFQILDVLMGSPADMTRQHPASSFRAQIAMAAMFRTEFAVFGIQYSPFERHKVAVACSQYYGLVGNGKLCLLHRSPAGWSLVRFCAPVRVRAPLV